MTHIYTFSDTESLTRKIDELKMNGVLPTKMIVVSKIRPTQALRNYFEIEFVKADGSIWEKWVGKLFDKDSGELVSRRFKFSEEEKTTYEEAINNNQFVLLVEESVSEKYKGVKEEDVKKDKEVQKEEQDLKEIYDEYGLNSEKVIKKE